MPTTEVVNNNQSPFFLNEWRNPKASDKNSSVLGLWMELLVRKLPIASLTVLRLRSRPQPFVMQVRRPLCRLIHRLSRLRGW